MDMINSTLVENIITQITNKGLNLGFRIIITILLVVIGSKLIKVVLNILNKALVKSGAETSVSQFLNSLVKVGLYVLLGFIVASYCGMDAASIVALLGSAGVAVGLALQGSLSNLAGGVLILLLNPFKTGDYIIDASGNEGSVDEITIFYTKLRTPDNKVIILPNGNLANNSITNVTTAKIRRCDIKVGISYNADIKKAKEALMELLNKDEQVLKDHSLNVYVDSLGDSAVNIGVRCWFNNDDYWDGVWRLNEEIKQTLDNNNIEIPFPQMDVHIIK